MYIEIVIELLKISLQQLRNRDACYEWKAQKAISQVMSMHCGVEMYIGWISTSSQGTQNIHRQEVEHPNITVPFNV